jgi:predicted house-cleaning noncanonical NTP pyrophosphatase (MazG superfamily)
MMNAFDLKVFLTKTMSMTEIYQPVIVKELLLNKGECTKDHLAKALAEYDQSIREYYSRIVMRYPKDTLTKHGVVRYQRNGERFLLNCDVPEKERQEAIGLCDAKITEWLQRKRDGEQAPAPNELVRYRVLKRAKGKCELCGIPSSLRPIDIDHVEPQSRADKNGNVVLDGKRVNVHSEDNLQALCIKCNRAKRDQDNTDYRRTSKLVRDRILYIIRQNGREPIVRRLSGKAIVKALNEKLVEEHEEYIEAGSVEELADMIEVIISLAKKKDTSQEELLQLVEEKRTERGVFEQGFFYVGDK